MRATVHDAAVLAAIRPLELASYLRSSGWTQQTWVPDRFAVWTKSDGEGDGFEVLLPLSRYKDFGTRIADLLRTLELAESRSQLEIIADLTNTNSDVVRITSQYPESAEGSIPIEHAVELVHKSRELMLAAACATVETRPYYPPRKFSQALAYLKRVRLGQTERGSFVVTVISPVPPALSTEERQVEEPYERQVTKLLSIALVEIQRASEQAVASGSMDAFRAAIEKGVSANLCDAVVGIAGGADNNRQVSIRISWSRSRAVTNGGPSGVDLSPDAIPIIEEAGRILREISPTEDFELMGLVETLDRPAGEEVGTATVLGFVDEKPRRVRMQLGESDYHTAVEAHDRQLPASCVGDLIKEGRSFMLLHPRQFRIMRDNEL
jgi:hypothetical protein